MTKEKPMYIVERFRTDFGEVHAVAVIVDETVRNCGMAVGLSFCTIEDRCMPRKVRNEIGRGQALQRALASTPATWISVPAPPDKLKHLQPKNGPYSRWRSDAGSKLRCQVVRMLQSAFITGKIVDLGVETYVNKTSVKRGDFVKWFTGPFMKQFSDRFGHEGVVK